MISPQQEKQIRAIRDEDGLVTVLTGAGISAESGIPTFRGPEGYWTVGSKVYHPQEMATLHMFRQRPDEVWRWYLHRATVCHRAAPNEGHRALVALEQKLTMRFVLITQNVDGLHLRAGSSPERTYQIHGNVFYMRCAAECRPDLLPLPPGLIGRERDAPLAQSEADLLICPACGGRTRPHVLWFDESYNEHHFRFQSALQAAARTRLLVVVGTSGATNLPNQVAWTVQAGGGTIFDVNIEANPFSELARQSREGAFFQVSSSLFLPALTALF
ncbi:MAG: Sir2 family NAD-dependent protein deacetylase [Desulfobacterales bacterium]|nr:Sir2 family NAD-dependent protein deacetylase [Desulfobacterales bacterium]